MILYIFVLHHFEFSCTFEGLHFSREKVREIQKWYKYQNSNLIFALKLSLLISSIDHNDKIICFTGRLLDPALTATLNLHQYLLNASQHASAIYAAGLGMVRPFLPFHF